MPLYRSLYLPLCLISNGIQISYVHCDIITIHIVLSHISHDSAVSGLIFRTTLLFAKSDPRPVHSTIPCLLA